MEKFADIELRHIHRDQNTVPIEVMHAIGYLILSTIWVAVTLHAHYVLFSEQAEAPCRATLENPWKCCVENGTRCELWFEKTHLPLINVTKINSASSEFTSIADIPVMFYIHYFHPKIAAQYDDWKITLILLTIPSIPIILIAGLLLRTCYVVRVRLDELLPEDAS